jgi:hypothetical protein
LSQADSFALLLLPRYFSISISTTPLIVSPLAAHRCFSARTVADVTRTIEPYFWLNFTFFATCCSFRFAGFTAGPVDFYFLPINVKMNKRLFASDSHSVFPVDLQDTPQPQEHFMLA